MPRARCPEVHDEVHDREGDVTGQLVAEVMKAVLSLEYGAVTISVKGGQVVGLERNEKRRLVRPPSQDFQLYTS